MKPKVIVILTLLALFLVILAQNTQLTTLRLLFWSVSVSQVVLIALVLLGGFAIGYLTAALTRNR